MICRKCNQQTPDGAQLCQWCGEPLFSAGEVPRSAMPQTNTYRGQHEAPAQKPEVVQAVKCPVCGALLPKDAESCSACGVQFRKSSRQTEPDQAAPAAETARRCHLCGKLAQPQEAFCSGCGFPLSAERKQPRQEQPKVPCPFCGQPVRSGVKFCNHCGASVLTEAVAAPTTPPARTTAAAPKKIPDLKEKWQEVTSGHKKLITWIGLGLGGLVALILIVSLIASLFGFSGPFTKLAKGTNALIKAKSFTADFAFEGEGEEIEGTLQLQYNLKKREVTMLVEYSIDGEDYVVGIYDEYFIEELPSGRVYAEDIGDQLDQIFDNLEDMEDEVDPEELLENMVDSIMQNGELEDIIDEDQLIVCLKKLMRKCNTSGWLRKNAGYTTKLEKGMTMHVFKPKLDRLATAALEVLEPAFEDEDDYEDALEAIEDSEDEINAIDVEFAFGLRLGKLARITFDVEVEDEGSYSGEINFSKIGTTRVDTDRLEDMLDDAER